MQLLISNFIVGKAFAVATAFVFGGAALVFGMVASKLELQNVSNFNYMQFFSLPFIIHVYAFKLVK